MAKTPRRSYRCSECGWETGKWVGRCNQCGEFGTLAEVASGEQTGLRSSSTGTEPSRPARQVHEISRDELGVRLMTGIGELDRVLGGGLVKGQVLLLSGEPGAGKSTLLLTAANSVAQATGRPVLYLSGEESVHQIATRARRIGANAHGLYLADTGDLGEAIGHLERLDDVALMIVDSVQTLASGQIDGRAGGVSQVMEVASTLTRIAKNRGLPMCLVGQVTKESTVAGPRALEHIVDTTLALEGEQQTTLRLLRSVKNRYGAADEVACFEQTDTGMVEVPDPSELFRGIRAEPVPGTCLTVTVAGRRPLLTEIQSLVSESGAPVPRRAVHGLDSSRVSMLAAVAEKHGGAPLKGLDLYVSTVGGMRSNDPGCDLAICLAITSALTGKTIPSDIAAIGEVSLTGDLRRVVSMPQRIAEAERLGYRRLLVPHGTYDLAGFPKDKPMRARIIEVESIGQALSSLLPRQLHQPPPPSLR